ncbi:MAG: hypothetical protein IT292_12465 [Deltaproteobacteria bacterium]|nr:hypothetical protein [Deltaproteobacteria bacterium]
MRKITSLALVVLLTSCSLSTVPEEQIIVKESPVPGTITEPWTETMYDSVKVPAQLDPTGTYYRPTHQTVVEVRPGRVQPLQYPEENDKVDNDWQR